jgi:cell division protein FtsL
MERVVINCQTKERTVVPFTAEEIAVIEAYERDVLPVEQMKELRRQRNQLLSETDYLALADSTLTDEMRTYRQALRDLPANTVDPANPVFPTKPEV